MGQECQACLKISADTNDKKPVTYDPYRVVTTRAGRCVRMTSLSAVTAATERENGEDVTGVTTNISWDYEDELDILVVLSHSNTVPWSDGEDDDAIEDNVIVLKTVTLIDNETLAVIKEIPINRTETRGPFDINHRVFVTLDRDILMINLQSCVKTTTYLYKLQEIGLNQRDVSKKNKSKSSKGSQRPNRLGRRSTDVNALQDLFET